jgi:hypothetical protein
LEDRAARPLLKQVIKTVAEPVVKPVIEQLIKALAESVIKPVIRQVVQEAQRRPPPVQRRPLREQVVQLLINPVVNQASSVSERGIENN